MTNGSARQALVAIVSAGLAAGAARGLEVLREQAGAAAGAHGGRVVENGAQDVTLLFASANEALEATLALLAGVPEARFGVHIGEAADASDIAAAARLCQAAAPGTALVSDDVRQMVHGPHSARLNRHGQRVAGVSFDIFAFGDAAAAAPSATREFLIAVLPFDNLSGDSEMVYFSDGVSEDILQAVAQSTKLKVAARTSSFQFRGPDKAAHKVAAELKATHLLDGSVRRSGTRVRISAHLIECAGQKQLWSDRFDRDLSDVFALQDEIAGAVAKALKAAFAPLMEKRPVDPAVYEDYLRVRAQIAAAAPWSVTAGLLQDIVARAPEFAQAWASLAMCLGAYISVENNLPYRIEGARGICARAAERALTLDPSAGIAYVARYALEPRCGAFEAREALLHKARELAPNDPIVLNSSSQSAKALGRRHEAFGYAERAHQLDPLYAQGTNWYAVMLSETGRLDEAYRVFAEGARRWPKFDSLIANPISVAACLEDWDRVDALIASAKAAGLDTPDIRGVSKLAQMKRSGDQAAIERRLTRFRELVARSGRVTFNDMCVLSALGRSAEAFDAIEDLSFAHLFTPEGKLQQGDYGIHNIMNASFPDLRRDPRFVKLCAKLGLCAYWVKSQRWPDFTGEVDYDFKRACTEAAA